MSFSQGYIIVAQMNVIGESLALLWVRSVRCAHSSRWFVSVNQEHLGQSTQDLKIQKRIQSHTIPTNMELQLGQSTTSIIYIFYIFFTRRATTGYKWTCGAPINGLISMCFPVFFSPFLMEVYTPILTSGFGAPFVILSWIFIPLASRNNSQMMIRVSFITSETHSILVTILRR